MTKRLHIIEQELTNLKQDLTLVTATIEEAKRKGRPEIKESLLKHSSLQKEVLDLAALQSKLQRVKDALSWPPIFQESPTWSDYLAVLHALRHMLEGFGNESITGAMAHVIRAHKFQEKGILQKTPRMGAVQEAIRYREETGANNRETATIISKKTGAPYWTLYNNLRKNSPKEK